MINKRHMTVINYLRKNARGSLVDLAKEKGCAQSTIYDQARNAQQFFTKSSVLLNFQKLGLIHQYFTISTSIQDRDNLRIFLEEHSNLNSLYRTTDVDFLAEAVFANMAESENFMDRLRNKFAITRLDRFMVVEELRKEDFLSKPDHLEVFR